MSSMAILETIKALNSVIQQLRFDQEGNLRVKVLAGEIEISTGTIKLLDSSNAVINPATSDNQETIIGRLDVNLSTRASETTLSGIKTQTDKLKFDTNGFLIVTSLVSRETSQVLNGETIDGGSHRDVDIAIGAGKSGVALTVKASYNASATNGISIDILYSPDGTNYDTDTDDTYTHPFQAGATKQKTYVIASVHPYMRVRITNNDPTYSVTVDAWVTQI